ncbi:hypothetical protein AAFF_G00105140 [Aldrovandia affinis]|uniref:Uncharacterized protein n=1 Tax=Aldrovandia affinis TaxID=143900 RepID=A0AAD7WXL3_9TELE|nr:hypothetical protein AAFF_G00105140 [Aldrovandia affinis]
MIAVTTHWPLCFLKCGLNVDSDWQMQDDDNPSPQAAPIRIRIGARGSGGERGTRLPDSQGPHTARPAALSLSHVTCRWMARVRGDCLSPGAGMRAAPLGRQGSAGPCPALKSAGPRGGRAVMTHRSRGSQTSNGYDPTAASPRSFILI